MDLYDSLNPDITQGNAVIIYYDDGYSRNRRELAKYRIYNFDNAHILKKELDEIEGSWHKISKDCYNSGNSTLQILGRDKPLFKDIQKLVFSSIKLT